MIEFSFADLQSWLATLLWPFCRIAGMLTSMVVLGARNVPARIRAGVAIVLTFAISGTIPALPNVELFSIQSALIIIQQVLIGLALGFVTQIIFQTFILGGQVIAMQAGLGFASLVDPTNGTSVPVISQFFLMLTTLLFISVDGHLVMIHIVANSFQTLPISLGEFDFSIFWQIVLWAKNMFAVGLTMSLSAVFALLIVNISFGVMTRAAPQLNIFAIGFPITMLSGMLIVWLTLGGFLPYFNNQLSNGFSLLCDITGVDC